jgi:hypothetical protein
LPEQEHRSENPTEIRRVIQQFWMQRKECLMKFLFDKGSSQVQVHLETGARLNTLFRAMEDQGWEHAIGPNRIQPARCHPGKCHRESDGINR